MYEWNKFYFLLNFSLYTQNCTVYTAFDTLYTIQHKDYG